MEREFISEVVNQAFRRSRVKSESVISQKADTETAPRVGAQTNFGGYYEDQEIDAQVSPMVVLVN